MTDATPNTATRSADTPDASMARLAPQPSRLRNRLLTAVGVLTLAAAALSPNLLRPSVLDDNGASAGSWMALSTNQQVVTITRLDPANWPGVDVRSVDDVRGASVDHAWIVDESAAASMSDMPDEADFDSGVDYLLAAMPGLDVLGDALPRRVDRNESAVLVVLWNISSCDALDTATPEPARVELRTIVRTSRHQTLPEIAAPGFSMDTLHASGACP